MKYHFTILLFWLSYSVFAQISNDNCDKPIAILNPVNYCSKAGEFTNVGATLSGYGAATCWNAASNDVWFSFVAVATDISIIVKGKINVSGTGGTMDSPQAALYQGTCGGVINELECGTTNNGIVQLYQGGLIIGETYLIRIQGRSNGVGTFQLCTVNYNPPKEPTGDCPTASILCDKSPFVVRSVKGAGVDNKEAEGAPCFAGTSGLVEMNSTWYAWTCDKSGTLTFTLSPSKEDDDLDFIVYELPNGVENCNGKQILRCMASGDNPGSYPNSPCMGPTGLNLTATDLSESAGCVTDLPKDRFAKALDMVSGKSYALMINNFTSTGNGFSVQFGGTGTFVGPVADFSIQGSNGNPICFGDNVIVKDSSTFALGAINKWTWNFGTGAVPSTASGPGPIAVKYTTPGEKYISLLIETEQGCQITKIKEFNIGTCCDSKNSIKLTNANVVNLRCRDIKDGSVAVNANSILPILGYQWSNGQTSNSINNLDVDNYAVTITNEVCDTVFQYALKSPPAILIDTVLTKPTCNGGQDGKIALNVSGGVPAYTYLWGNGNQTNQITNLPIGIYPVTVTDNNNCKKNISIDLKELELELNPNVQAITPPTCFGFSNGRINVVIANGKAPYQYNFNDGKGFVNSNVLNNIPKGIFVVEVLDANGCKGKFTLDVPEPPAVEVDLDTINVTCFGLANGQLSANVVGGVGNYRYQWQNGTTSSINSSLVAGTYDLTVADGNGCTVITKGTVTQPPLLVLSPVNRFNLICFGDSIGALSVLGSGGSPSYTYSLDDLVYQKDTLFQNLRAGKYLITVKDSLGCKATTTMTLTQPEQIIVDAGRDTIVDLGFPITLRATYTPRDREVTFKWTPTENILKCGNCPRTEVFPLRNTYFHILLTDNNGCTATDSVLVAVNKKRPVFIPNAFSPNFDGWNDRFTAFSNQSAKRITLLRVYNRWGGLLYETKNIPLNEEKYGWDGFFNGKELVPEVFTYYLEIEFIDGEIVPYKGDITIIK
jgi:gliding motility-associated-like protein